MGMKEVSDLNRGAEETAMKVLNEEVTTGKPNTFILIVDKKEAQTLMAMAETASKANKRSSLFRNMYRKLEERLSCF